MMKIIDFIILDVVLLIEIHLSYIITFLVNICHIYYIKFI